MDFYVNSHKLGGSKKILNLMPLGHELMKPSMHNTKNALNEFFVQSCDWRMAKTWHVGEGAHTLLIHAMVMSVGKMDKGLPQVPHCARAVFPSWDQKDFFKF